MKYLAAYTLLVLAGNNSPSEADVTNLLKEVGIEADKDSVGRVVSALKGKNLEEVIAEGSKKTQSLSFGGGSAPAPAAQAAAPVAKKEEPKKVEKAPEPEEDVDMGGLFDF